MATNHNVLMTRVARRGQVIAAGTPKYLLEDPVVVDEYPRAKEVEIACLLHSTHRDIVEPRPRAAARGHRHWE